MDKNKTITLKPNRKYLLKYSPQFSHAVGEKGFLNFSRDLHSEDTIIATFIGCADIGIFNSKRNIFHSSNKERYYFSYGCEDLDYIVKEISN